MPVKIGLLLVLITALACKSTDKSQSKILSAEVDSGPANAILASPSTLFEISSCVAAAPEEFAGLAKELDRLRTKRRPTENSNRCTGCSQAACTVCHADNLGGFFAPSLDTAWSEDLKAIIRFDMESIPELQFSFAKTYFRQNGSFYVPTNKIQEKADATNSGPPYSHPNFTVPAELNQAFIVFTSSIAKKVNAGFCKKP